ncbi:VTT domain-containing protein [Bradyrhizobium sp. RT3b]|uniref:TVP38/TMEM64 family protein n=1 Tax=Bradyrhizobium sp. RT3b TaxID=3156334 RepID=UPI003397E615
MIEQVIYWFQKFGHLSVGSGLALGFFFFMAALIVFPRTPLILTAGAAFGLGAVPIILLGGTAGSMLAFSLSRYFASDWFRQRLQRKPTLRTIAEAVDQEGWRIVALLRLGVPIPSALQNYLLGLTSMDLITYSVSTFVFSIPQIFLLALLGATGRASALGDSPLALSLATIALTITIIAMISWRVRRLLAARQAG